MCLMAYRRGSRVIRGIVRSYLDLLGLECARHTRQLGLSITRRAYTVYIILGSTVVILVVPTLRMTTRVKVTPFRLDLLGTLRKTRSILVRNRVRLGYSGSVLSYKLSKSSLIIYRIIQSSKYRRVYIVPQPGIDPVKSSTQHAYK